VTLLREIQNAAVASETPITDLLRRCKILAARLGSKDFAEWVDRELNGYNTKEELPPYRIGDVTSLGTFVGAFGRGAKNVPIPPSNIPKEWRDFATKTYMLQPISAFEQLLGNPDSGTFQSPWPTDIVKYVSDQIIDGMSLISAWQQIPRGLVVSLIDSVRNRILSFALDLEKVAPQAGEGAVGAAPINPEKVHQVFQTNIYGNVATYAAGSSDVSQTVGSMITQGDYSALGRELTNLGFTEQDIDELKVALEQDANCGEKRIGRSVGAWLGKALGKAGEGVLKVSVDVAAKVLPSLISQHLGLPPSH